MQTFRCVIVIMSGLVLAVGCSGPDWTEGLDSADETVRKRAMDDLAGRGEEVVFPLVKALAARQRSHAFVLGAAGVLRRIGAAAEPALEKGLHGEDSTVRIWSLVAAGVIGSHHRDLAGRLLAGLEPGPAWKDPRVRSVADHVKHALSPPGDDRKLEILLHRLQGRKPPAAHRPEVPPGALPVEDPHLATVLALLKIGPVHAAACPGLRAALKSACPGVRMRAAEALGMPGLPGEAGMADLAAALSDRDHRVRTAAALALAEVGEAARSARKQLLPLLEDYHDLPRLAGATALFSCAGGNPGEDLTRAMQKALRRRPTRRMEPGTAGSVGLDDVSCASTRKLLEHVYGIKIVFVEDDLEHDLLQGLRYRPVDPATRLFHLVALLQVLACYPIEVVRQDLDGVWIVRELAYADGLRIGGTYHNGHVILVVKATSVDGMAVSLHHEFSSVLMRKHSFPRAAWRAANPPGFQYGRGGMVAIRRGCKTGGSPSLYDQGFFEEYGQADLENDFNTFSETVLAFPEKALRLIRQHPRLREKWKIWIDFYSRIHPDFGAWTVLGGKVDP